jgi:hypothetical protein
MIRPTETPGVFNFMLGAPKLEEYTELYTGNDAVMDFIKANIGQRVHGLTFGEVVYLSPGRYVSPFFSKLGFTESWFVKNQCSYG